MLKVSILELSHTPLPEKKAWILDPLADVPKFGEGNNSHIAPVKRREYASVKERTFVRQDLTIKAPTAQSDFLARFANIGMKHRDYSSEQSLCSKSEQTVSLIGAETNSLNHQGHLSFQVDI